MNPADTYTIDDFISYGKSLSVSYYYGSIMEILSNDIYIVAHNIFNDYKDEILEESVIITFNSKEYNRYMFEPRLLAYDIYGYTDLFFIIMLLNDVNNVKDFNFKSVTLLHPSKINLLGKIINAEKSYISKNKMYLKEKENEI